MSKSLEALKELKEACETHMGRMVYILQEDKFETIEKELKDYEYWTSFVKCYGDVKAEDLQRFIHNGWVYDRKGYKEDKALKIIKKKGIILQFIKETYTVEQYNVGVDGTLVQPLTQEEYNLLKEVLL